MLRPLSIFLVSLYLSSTAYAGEWPKLHMEKEDALCHDAMEIAKYDFHSSRPYLPTLRELPTESTSTIIISRNSEKDISGGNALEISAEYFDTIPVKDGIRHNIYWQKVAVGGVRLVLDESPVGWRGDMYGLYAVDKTITQDKIIAAITSNEFHKPNAGWIPIIRQSWAPPLVMQSSDKGIWLIDVGYFNNGVLLPWRIIVQSDSGIETPCTIAFKPDVRDSLLLLPASVRKLGYLLLDTMGDGKDDGTLQPTGRLKFGAQGIWANAALRPWALDEPNNTREDVDEALHDWAKGVKSFYALYNDIYTLYPTAQKDLAAYYRKNFRLNSNQAKKLAAYALDIAFRSHYVFSKGGNGGLPRKPSDGNPWNSFKQK